jgi:hypothetical protein
MKKFITVFILCAGFAVSAFAGPHGHHGNWHHRGGHNPWVWIAPAIVGGVIGYELRNQPPVVIQQQPVIVQQPVYSTQFQNCTAWVETQHPDGSITRTRTCS